VDNAFWQWNDVWLSPAFRAFDIRRDCAAIAAPLLLVQGRQDEYGTLDQPIAALRPSHRTELLKLAACGHSPHRDQPQALIEATRDFLQRHDGSPPRMTP